ncbi:MAG: tRNA uridine-5-carboxymethylaminomethyl(34) synthesis GTPase MnmE [Clostridiaceae bacterium]|nr:tRNA uridine-5-carboxymethylaminomethyl(34) synthesis GTPase MnmE [Clostridiaceae bacterium]
MSLKSPNDIQEYPFYGAICAAAATPPGQSGLAVIRLSGPRCAEAAARIFKPAGNFLPVTEMAGYTCALGYIVDPADHKVVDQVILTRFIAPHSYTGEDVIELSCHGGSAVKQTLLRILFDMGIRPAQPGEFTRRAFMHGKMDLVQAEAVMDLIQAGAERSAQVAAGQLRGAISRQVRHHADDLYRLLAQIELILEYPEHEDTAAAIQPLAAQLAGQARALQEWAASFSQGRFLREGMTVVIAGRPNVGKSSLLNALAGHERAIVTAIPGTTRDTVEERVDLAGLPVRLIDTAGLRETGDPIEKIGVGRTKEAVRDADLVFWLLSPPMEDLEAEIEAMKTAGCRTVIPLIGKEDLADSAQFLERVQTLLPDGAFLTCSAQTGEGLEQIRRTILDHYEQAGSAASDEQLITSSRHKACLDRAADCARQGSDALTAGLPLDIVASLVRGSLDALAELTGDAVSDELIQTIFSRFCVGK